MSIQKKQVEGDVEHGFADADTNKPVKIGGRARQTNPTAVFNTERVEAMFDDVGRQIVVPFQVRDLIFTASADTATLAEVTLLAGTASVFNDLIEITCANQSGAAVTLSLRETTGGPVVKTLTVGASTTISRDFPMPVPQSVQATAWTIQNAGSGDISGTVVSVSALFVRNV